MTQIIGTADRDILRPPAYPDRYEIFGLAGDDQISFTTSGFVTVDAGPGVDYVGAGGSGTVTLGADHDALAVGFDSWITVTDFQPGAGGDTVVLLSSLGDFERAGVWIEQHGPDAVLMTMGSGPKPIVLFSNVNAASLTPDNFVSNNGYSETSTNPQVGLRIFAAGSQQFGTAGDDGLTGSVNADTVMGGDGRDYLRGLEGADSVNGGAEDDDANGNQGEDVVRGGAGADWVRGGQGQDTVYGDIGNDPHLNGNLGNDVVYGGDGDDAVYGGQGADTLFGESGNDVLSGDRGRDTIYGGAGADRFILQTAAEADYLMDFAFAEGDRIQLTAGATYTVQNSGWVSITLSSGDSLTLVGNQAGTFSADWIVYV